MAGDGPGASAPAPAPAAAHTDADADAAAAAPANYFDNDCHCTWREEPRLSFKAWYG